MSFLTEWLAPFCSRCSKREQNVAKTWSKLGVGVSKLEQTVTKKSAWAKSGWKSHLFQDLGDELLEEDLHMVDATGEQAQALFSEKSNLLRNHKQRRRRLADSPPALELAQLLRQVARGRHGVVRVHGAAALLPERADRVLDPARGSTQSEQTVAPKSDQKRAKTSKRSERKVSKRSERKKWVAPEAREELVRGQRRALVVLLHVGDRHR